MSTDSLFNQHWYRVKALKPRLASDVVINRHVYRGVPCYVLHRQSDNQIHRASVHTIEVIAKFDGEHTVDQLWQLALAHQGDDAPSQSDFMQLLGQLHEAEMMTVDRRLNAEHLFSRSEAKNRSAFKQRYLNPLFMRFNLIDPDRFLTFLYQKLSWIFGRTFAVAWVLLIVVALIEIVPSWSVMRYEMAELELLSPMYALLFVLVYPTLKLLHELSHGLVLKRYGCEVHELGIALMVLLPIPYVDASSATVLSDKRARMLISAAGIVVECGVAAIAALLWVNSSGTLHDVALLIMLIGGLSTLVFNANPLLKFDGYYVLADWLEIPNLANRSKEYLQARLSSSLLGIVVEVEDPVDHREKLILLSYGVLSLVYRIGLMLSIAWILSGEYFFFGFLLALWIVATLMVFPLVKFFKFLRSQTGTSRTRAISISAVVTFSVMLFLFFIPLPFNTVGKGIVWLPDDAIVRVASDCEVTQLAVVPGSQVSAGDVLIICSNPELKSEISILQSKLDEVNAKSKGLGVSERVEKLKLGHEAKAISGSLARAREKQEMQRLVAGSDGRFVVTEQTQLEGRYFTQGAIAAYIITPGSRTVRMAIEQNNIAMMRDSVRGVELKFIESVDFGASYKSGISRQTPKADLQLSSAGLTTAGGGSFVADPAGDGSTVLEPIFDLELLWPLDAPEVNVGSHVFVKLNHPPAPLANRLMSGVKRAFLGRVGV